MSRKFRWRFGAIFPMGEITPQIVRVAVRPEWDNEKKEPKQGGSFTTTFLDFKNEDNPKIYEIMSKFYRFGGKLFEEEGTSLSDMKAMMGTATLEILCPTAERCPNCDHILPNRMFMGTGPLEPIEEWKFTAVWPSTVDFGELCYSSSEEVYLTITWRYKTSEYTNKTFIKEDNHVQEEKVQKQSSGNEERPQD